MEALEHKRDDCLIAIMQALRAQDFASGTTLAAYEEKLFGGAHRGEPGLDATRHIAAAASP